MPLTVPDEAEESPRGPIIYEIARAIAGGLPPVEMFEFPVYSDAHITGQTDEIPWSLINNVSMPSEPGDFRPVIIVRAKVPQIGRVSGPINATDTSRYHGGSLQDEVAAIVSLQLSIRAKAGAIDRVFDGLDGPGHPRGYDVEGWPPRLYIEHRRPRLPWATGQHALTSGMFARLADLSAEQAAAFIKAARSYQKGMWIAELDPEQAWLYFVAAVEAVDRFIGDANRTDAELLLEYHADIAQPIFDVSPELLTRIAPKLRALYGSTRKFVDFILANLPEPPAERPQSGQLTWTTEGLKPVLRTIYNHRSKALHDGTPFPYPMCQRPARLSHDSAVMESPPFIGSSGFQGQWLREDTPTYLHVFAYIVQGALLKWWQSIA